MITKMILIRDLVKKNISKNKWLEELETLFLEIENNIESEPDISIESCKSLLESIAKNILMRLDSTYNAKKANNTAVHTLLANARDKLSEKIIDGEYELISRFTSAVAHINDIRNGRGDISHGKTLPKEIRSSIYFARTIATFTDAFAYYILHIFLSIDFSYKEELKYEDNLDFNNYLDELTPIVGISYSKALFDQDPVSYEEGLEQYKSDFYFE